MTAAPVPSHPLLDAVATARSAIAETAELQPVYLPAQSKQAALEELAALRAQVDELELRVLAASGDAADAVGFRDAGQWLARITRVDTLAGHGSLKLAQALDTKYAVVAEGMRAGVVNRTQARIIVDALEELPATIESFARRQAEAHLVEFARDYAPRELRNLGKSILHVIAPQIADEEDAKALEREERRARIKCSMKLRPIGDGSTRINGVLPDAVAARLQTYLDAYTSPRRGGFDTASPGGSAYSTTGGEVERLPRHRRLGQAFSALLEHLDPAKLPDHGGDATTVIVTIDHDKLTQDLATAGLMGSVEGETRISATQARRLACTAKILPAVLGGKGEVLDLGRAQRLFTPAQRKALRIRDKQCRAEGCTIPAAWCEAHHRKPWSQGGGTDLADGILLCSFHHHRAHDPRFAHDLLPNGDWRFHRRT